MNKHSKRFAKFVAVSSLLLNIAACSTPPKFISAHFDAQDRCQTKSRPADTPPPKWCGKGADTYFVTQPLSRNMYVISR